MSQLNQKSKQYQLYNTITWERINRRLMMSHIKPLYFFFMFSWRPEISSKSTCIRIIKNTHIYKCLFLYINLQKQEVQLEDFTSSTSQLWKVYTRQISKKASYIFFHNVPPVDGKILFLLVAKHLYTSEHATENKYTLWFFSR